MYQVHLAVVLCNPKIRFTQALGPRDELDERQSLHLHHLEVKGLS